MHTPYPVLDQQIFFTYGRASKPPTSLHDSSAEIVTPKGNPMPCNNPPYMVTHSPSDPDSDTSLSYSSSLDSSDL